MFFPCRTFDNRIRMAEYRSIYGFGGLYRYGLGTQPSIHIIVDNGHVTLVGVVDNEGDKNLAQHSERIRFLAFSR